MQKDHDGFQDPLPGSKETLHENMDAMSILLDLHHRLGAIEQAVNDHVTYAEKARTEALRLQQEVMSLIQDFSASFYRLRNQNQQIEFARLAARRASRQFTVIAKIS